MPWADCNVLFHCLVVQPFSISISAWQCQLRQASWQPSSRQLEETCVTCVNAWPQESAAGHTSPSNLSCSSPPAVASVLLFYSFFHKVCRLIYLVQGSGRVWGSTTLFMEPMLCADLQQGFPDTPTTRQEMTLALRHFTKRRKTNELSQSSFAAS